MKVPNVFPLVIFLFSALFSCAQTTGYQSLAQLQESPAGSKVIAFVQLVNEGAELNEGHIKKIFSQHLIEKHSAEKLAGMVTDIRETDGQLELWDANRVKTFEYQLIMKGLKNDEWLSLNLNIEKQSPYKIDGLGLQNTHKKPKAQSAMLVPGKAIAFEARPKNYASQKAIGNKADELAKAYMDMNWFAGVIMVAKDGIPFYQKAFGMADEARAIPNTMNTKFRIGSINKNFTETLVLQMVERKQLSFDDHLSKFDLGFPKETADKITIRHLLTHTAGFADIFTPEYLNNIRAYKNIDDILPLLREEPLIYPPGEDQRYSNYGFIVLGAILEKVSGRQFGDLLQKNILDVIGANNTHYDVAENIEGEARSYRFQLDGTKIDHTGQLEYCTPDGGMYSTAEDLLKYFQALIYTEKLVSNATKVAMANGYRNTKGNWNNIVKEHGAGIGSAGGGPGVSTLVEMNWPDNYTLIVLANTDQQIAEELGLKLMSFIYGRPDAEPRLPVQHFVYQILQQKGVDYLRTNFAQVMDQNGYGANPEALNGVGYQLMNNGDLDKAITIFQLNTELFPEEANPYDSLGEAYFKKGDSKKALKYYKKALEIDPNFPSAKKMVREIEK